MTCVDMIGVFFDFSLANPRVMAQCSLRSVRTPCLFVPTCGRIGLFRDCDSASIGGLHMRRQFCFGLEMPTAREMLRQESLRGLASRREE